MKILLFNQQKALPIKKTLIKKAILLFFQKYKVKSEEIAVYFVTKSKIKQLHLKYFHDASATDCITFPFDPPTAKGFLGEVFICPQVAREYAAKHKRDPNEEMLLYIMHSLLHLLGYKDFPKKEKIHMQKKEKACMRLLKNNLLFLSKNK